LANKDMRLWYKQPAMKWVEALPVGNGRLGGMVFGGVAEERIQLNEDTLWSGVPKDTNNYEAINHLEEARNLILDEKYPEAQKVIEENMLGSWNESYLPLGDLLIKDQTIGPVTNYSRELDIDQAVATTSYTRGNVDYKRRVFVSAVDQVMIVELMASQMGQLNVNATLTSLLNNHLYTDYDNHLALAGRCPSHVLPNYVNDPNPVVYSDEKGMRFETQLRKV